MSKGKVLVPMLSFALVAGCTMLSLCGYEAPVYTMETGKTEEIIVQEEDVEVEGLFDLEDGVYKGTGVGFAGDVTVAVEIKDRSIIDIEVLSSLDDAAFFNRAKDVISKMISTQSLEVDTVSGATYSSKGIINAVKNALTGKEDTSQAGNSQSASGTISYSPTVETITEASAYKDGIYYGTGTGFGGAIKVEVKISSGKISSVRIIQHSDGSSYIASASAVIDRIIANQTTNVDTVSGATYSSAGIIQAVRSALSQAAVGAEDTENSSDNKKEEEAVGTVPYVEGIYFGTAEGYAGDITVAVVIQEETIKAILVTENEDDEAFFGRAMDVVKNVIKQQNTEVDTVSGATYSSEGLLKAIKNALTEAEKVTKGENLSALENVIAEAQTLNKEDYTELSWAILQIRLEDAKEAQEFEIQKYIDIAERKLRDAIDSLVLLEGDTTDKEENEDNNEEDGDAQEPMYMDGTYEATVLCVPDENEDFESYNLSLKIKVENNKIVAITDIQGDGDSANERYIEWAANGRGDYVGVVQQIVEKGTTEEIDTVSRATCSSKSIIEACEKALESAIRQ